MILSRWKIFTIIAICLSGIIISLPNLLTVEQRAYLPRWMQNTINLGLDLQGGSYLQLEVDLKAVTQEHLNGLLDDIRSALRAQQIGYTALATNSSYSGITFMLRNPDQSDKVMTAIKKVDPELMVKIGPDGEVLITLSEVFLEQKKRSIVDQSIEVVRRRIDEYGTSEPSIQSQGNDRIVVQLPGVSDPAEVKKLLGRTAKMSFHLVDPEVGAVAVTESGKPKGGIPPGSMIVPEEHPDGSTTYLVVKKRVMVSGDSLIDAQATVNQTGEPAVSLKFNALGAKKFAKMSEENLKKRFAIVLDNKIISAPAFREVIPDGNGQISGNFSIKEANDLALLLRAGALPAPLKVIEERTVGPSLGADSIRAGQLATVLGIILVAIFMLVCYSLFGVFANIAVVFNLVLLFAALSFLQATLTLPGIAGIALTIGMAVDANVLINERIKEELRNGLRPIAAIEAGYNRAMTTIVDSNLTTLIGAAFLFEFGTGPIRGFAVTLTLGILISMFTAISLTRLIASLWIRRRKLSTLPI